MMLQELLKDGKAKAAEQGQSEFDDEKKSRREAEGRHPRKNAEGYAIKGRGTAEDKSVGEKARYRPEGNSEAL
jgi:hypothetical protein